MRKVRQLYAMLDGAGCRAAAVRRYFGERGSTRAASATSVQAADRHDATEAAQKALSAVHRLGGRFGRGRVVDHLLGKTKDAAPAETQMSTFGIGREFSPPGWRDLLDQLLFEGLLREDPNDGRPLIGLGEANEVRAVYRGERRVAMRQLPPERSPGTGLRARASARSGERPRRGSRRCRAVRSPACLAARSRRRAACAALCDLPRHHAFGHRPPATPRPRGAGKSQRRWPEKAGRYGADVLAVVRAA